MENKKPVLHKRYFLAVDGFRLLASINIVIFHLQGIGGLWDLREKPEWLFRIIKGPAFHASVFFLLGGFIFTIKFADKASTFNTWAFCKKRFSELFPLHLITTIAMAVLKIIHDAADSSLDISKLIVSIFMHLSFLWALFPFGTYVLNRPSWALSAFFLCYLLFGTILKKVVLLKKKRACIALAVVSMVPITLWSLLYGALGMPENYYHFFHTFACIRFFEFFIGMLLARFFLLSESSPLSKHTLPILNDAIIVASMAIIFITLQFSPLFSKFIIFFNYHVTMIPLYFIILYGLATEQGTISKILTLPFIRKTGRSSFYPYLIHIPLISIITYTLERHFSYYQFLHRPLHIVLFMMVLYGGAYIYVNHLRKRKPSGPSTKKQ